MIATERVSDGDTPSTVLEISCLWVLGLDVTEAAESASCACEFSLDISNVP